MRNTWSMVSPNSNRRFRSSRHRSGNYRSTQTDSRRRTRRYKIWRGSSFSVTELEDRKKRSMRLTEKLKPLEKERDDEKFHRINYRAEATKLRRI